MPQKTLYLLLPEVELSFCPTQVNLCAPAGEDVSIQGMYGWSIIRGGWSSPACPAAHHPHYHQIAFCQRLNRSPCQESGAGLGQKIRVYPPFTILLGPWCPQNHGHLHCFHIYVNKDDEGQQKPSRIRVGLRNEGQTAPHH